MNNEKPLLIGLTCRETQVYISKALYNNLAYVDYLKAADPDVLAVTLPVVTAEEAKRFADILDGLFITGGEDIDPLFYHEEPDGSEAPYDRKFDESDFALYHAFVEAGKPVLGVCRGIQVINVAEGGSLIQDIPSLTGTQHNQLKAEPPIHPDETFHTVQTADNTLLRMLVGTQISVNSFHHQAVKEPAPTLTVSAYSPDGIIEAVEKDRVLAVQWHPERMLDDQVQIRIARAFLSMCRSAQDSD